MSQEFSVIQGQEKRLMAKTAGFVCPFTAYAGVMRIGAVAVEMVRSYLLSAIGNQQQLRKHAHKQGDN